MNFQWSNPRHGMFEPHAHESCLHPVEQYSYAYNNVQCTAIASCTQSIDALLKQLNVIWVNTVWNPGVGCVHLADLPAASCEDVEKMLLLHQS